VLLELCGCWRLAAGGRFQFLDVSEAKLSRRRVSREFFSKADSIFPNSPAFEFISLKAASSSAKGPLEVGHAENNRGAVAGKRNGTPLRLRVSLCAVFELEAGSWKLEAGARCWRLAASG